MHAHRGIGIAGSVAAAVAFVGSFAVRNSVFDVFTCFGFGIIGWYLRRYGYPVVPIVLGIVLGSIVETNFRKAVLMAGYTVFIQRPVCLTILLVSFASILVPILFSNRKRTKSS